MSNLVGMPEKSSREVLEDLVKRGQDLRAMRQSLEQENQALEKEWQKFLAQHLKFSNGEQFGLPDILKRALDRGI